MTPPQIAALVPTFNNPHTLRGVVENIRARGITNVLVVDDGSDDPGITVCRQLVADGIAQVLRRPNNGGKGAACKDGFARLHELGFSHAFQIDADGQHDTGCIAAFVAAATKQPEAVVLGYPVYDETAPRSRRIARGLTDFWVGVEVGGRGKIRDAMIGFRIYPLAATMALPKIGDRMEFDIEVAVQLVRNGTPTINLPVPVRYLTADEGGVSHFRPLRDNLRFAAMHSKLCTASCVRWTMGKLWPFGNRRETTS